MDASAASATSTHSVQTYCVYNIEGTQLLPSTAPAQLYEAAWSMDPKWETQSTADRDSRVM